MLSASRATSHRGNENYTRGLARAKSGRTKLGVLPSLSPKYPVVSVPNGGLVPVSLNGPLLDLIMPANRTLRRRPPENQTRSQHSKPPENPGFTTPLLAARFYRCQNLLSGRPAMAIRPARTKRSARLSVRTAPADPEPCGGPRRREMPESSRRPSAACQERSSVLPLYESPWRNERSRFRSRGSMPLRRCGRDG